MYSSTCGGGGCGSRACLLPSRQAGGEFAAQRITGSGGRGVEPPQPPFKLLDLGAVPLKLAAADLGLLLQPTECANAAADPGDRVVVGAGELKRGRPQGADLACRGLAVLTQILQRLLYPVDIPAALHLGRQPDGGQQKAPVVAGARSLP